MSRLIVLCLLAVLFPVLAWGFTADEKLNDPALEKRAREIFMLVRCAVCSGQSIHDSNAELARDMRIVIRGKVKAGESDKMILAYLRERYGEDIVLKPSFNAGTVLLWIFPLIMLFFCGLILRKSILFSNRRK